MHALSSIIVIEKESVSCWPFNRLLAVLCAIVPAGQYCLSSPGTLCLYINYILYIYSFTQQTPVDSSMRILS